MEFEGQYLTYQEYLDLGGSAIGEMPFNLLEFEARREIDERTHNRLKLVDEIPTEVKLCEFFIMNKVLNYNNEEISLGKSSESVGSYSVSYNNNVKEIFEIQKDEIDNIILSQLYGVIVNSEHIIYCGVD